MRDNII